MGEITKKEFWELLQEFSENNLDPKFNKIEERFEKIDARFGKVDDRFERINSQFVEFKEEIIHQFHVISEDVISKLQLVAEGLINLDEKFNRRMDDFEKKNEEQHKDIWRLSNFLCRTRLDGSQPLRSEMKDLKLRMDKIERAITRRLD